MTDQSKRIEQLITAAMPIARFTDNEADLRALVALCHDSIDPEILYDLAIVAAAVISEASKMTGLDSGDMIRQIVEAFADSEAGTGRGGADTQSMGEA